MLKAYISLVMAMMIVGSSVVAGKIMVDGMPVFLSSAMRFLLSSVVMLPVLFFKEGGMPRLSRFSWGILFLQAFCGSFLFTVCLLYGLKYISPASAGIITSTTPAFMGVIGWCFFREKISLQIIAGISLSIIGIMILNTGDRSGYGQGSLTGFLFMFGAVAAESLFLVLRKRITEPLSPLAATTIISIFGFLWFFPSGLYEFYTTDLSAVSTTSWCAVLYYGLVVTVLAYLFWFYGVVRVQASVAGVFTGIMPIAAVSLSAMILGERIYWNHYAGCALVLCSILLTSGIHVFFINSLKLE